MALATCSAWQSGSITWPTGWGASGRYKIISDREFVFGGKVYPAGRISDPIDQNWCALGTIAVSSGVPTFSAFTLPQTDSGVTVVNGSGEPTFTLIYYAGNTKRGILFQSWRIGASLTTSFNFETLAIYNSSISVINPRTDFLGTDAINNLITARLYAPASATQIGLVRVSVPPVDTAAPIAAGDNDRRLVSTVHNVDAYPYNAIGGGVTDDHVAIQAALTAAGLTGGVVVLPRTYSIGATGLTVPSNVTLLSPAARSAPNIFYSGTGIAIDTYGSQYVGLQNLYVQTTNDAATGFRFGNNSHWCWGENLTHQGTNTLTNTGTGFDFDSRGGSGVFSGSPFLRQIYSLGNKFGITVEGTNAGTETWSTIWIDGAFLIGRSSGIIPNSIAIKTDNKSNLENSTINNLTIEAFATPYSFANAASCFGFSMPSCGNEGNTNPPSFPLSWCGFASDPHDGGYFQSASANGISNRWFEEFKQSGVWTTASFYQKLHNYYDGNSDTLPWGLRRGGSLINGELVRDKFIVSTGNSADFGYVKNNLKLLEFKIAFNSAVPTDGSWGIGSRIPNSVPAVGSPTEWVCTASGTFKTALAGVTGGITINTRSLVVNSISTLAVGDYISIVGATGTKLIVAISGTTITIDSDASATVAAAAVQYVTPTFQPVDNLGTARGARVTSQFDVTSSTLAAVPGLSIMVEAGFTYTFVARLYTTSDVAAGVKAAIAGTCVPLSFTCTAVVFNANTVSGPTRTATKGNTVGNVTAVTAAYIEIVGTIATDAGGGGTLTVQFAQNAANVAASSVLVNSTFETKLIG